MDRVEEIRKRAEAATPGPWHAAPDKDDPSGPPHVWTDRDVEVSEFSRSREDATFIAHARTDVPYLLSELDAARAEIGRLKADRIAGYRNAIEIAASPGMLHQGSGVETQWRIVDALRDAMKRDQEEQAARERAGGK